MGYNLTVSDRLRRLKLYGFICLLISSIGCFFLGKIFIVDAASIELFSHEPPYQWDYIYAGIYNLICSIIGLISARYNYSKAGLKVPIVGSLFMISGAMLEEFILLDWSINVIIILFCTAYLIIAYRIDYYNRVLRLRPHNDPSHMER